MVQIIPFKFLLFLMSLHLLWSLTISSSAAPDDNPLVYIIHMDVSAKPAPFSTHENWHSSILASLPQKAETHNSNPPTHLYTYSHVLDGFTAVLTPSQLRHLEQMPGYLASLRDSRGKLQTTRSPKFLGLTRGWGIWPTSGYGEDIIIGIIDSGVWPESESFSDQGMPPVPRRWKGVCETGEGFGSSFCNRKLIGARYFSNNLHRDGLNTSASRGTPRDTLGHGTHVASTAAGSWVDGVSYFGYASGTAIGTAPMARVAMYKPEFDNVTDETVASNVLVAMDMAITDGVDIISLSMAFPTPSYYDNVIAIGAFAAMEKGIFVSCSAGNDGPEAYTMLNSAPWLTSVGAATIDRDFIATVALAGGKDIIQGRSIFPENIFISNVPLYYGDGNVSKESCGSLALDPRAVAGKIVFCSGGTNLTISTQMMEVNRTGAKGAIFASDAGRFLTTDDFFMPFVAVGLQDGELIKKYATGAVAPAVDIAFVLTELDLKPAPQVAGFSSRGPSRITPGILKPDLVAPGVDILGAWVPNDGFAPIGEDHLVTNYALLSGTSMSTPHVAGIAAMLRSVHPNWSPAAIRSAMMTTADVTDNTGGPIVDMFTKTEATPLDFGAGHVNPNKAMDPGLVYDVGADDYLDYLCALNYTALQIGLITRRPRYNCTEANIDLNYPSFVVVVIPDANASSTHAFKRVLTNVGGYATSYRAVVNASRGVKVAVEPVVLSFEEVHSRSEFSITVETAAGDGAGGSYGFLSWFEIGGKHIVRSPIVYASTP